MMNWQKGENWKNFKNMKLKAFSTHNCFSLTPFIKAF